MSKYPATFTWSAVRNLGTGFDVDNLKGESGFYEVTSPTNGPSGTGPFTIMVLKSGNVSGKTVQVAWDQEDGAMNVRKWSGSAWSSWALQAEVAGADDVAFDPSGLDQITKAEDVQAALEAVDAILEDLDTRLAVVEGKVL